MNLHNTSCLFLYISFQWVTKPCVMVEFFLREMFLAEKIILQCGKIYVDEVVQGSFSMSSWTIFSYVIVFLSISGIYIHFTEFMIEINTEIEIVNS